VRINKKVLHLLLNMPAITLEGMKFHPYPTFSLSFSLINIVSGWAEGVKEGEKTPTLLLSV
jgi:hypothetical protein